MRIRKLSIIALAMLCLGLFTGVCFANEGENSEAQSAKKEKVRHPIMAMSGDYEGEHKDGMYLYQNTYGLSLKNVSHTDIDGVKVKLVVKDGNREVQKLEKEVGTMAAGSRKYVRFKWEDTKMRQFHPTLFITYNDEENGEALTFETRPSNW